MGIYWNDVIDHKDKWSHLQIEVKKSPAPSLYFLVGGNRRMILKQNNQSVFWAAIEDRCYGVWVARNFTNTKKSHFFPSIPSHIIQQASSLSNDEKSQFWSRYFIKNISKAEFSFLYPGTWRISQAKLEWEYQESKVYEKWVINETKIAFEQPPLVHLDWGISGNGNLVALKPKSPKDSDRVKWWRKCIQAGNCPPVLAWFITSLDAFIIIDGHDRLQAHLLENKLPEIYVIHSLKEYFFSQSSFRQEKIIKGLEIREKDPFKRQLTIEEKNTILLKAFENGPYQDPYTAGTAKHGFEEQWLKEIGIFKAEHSLDLEEYEMMIKNQP